MKVKNMIIGVGLCVISLGLFGCSTSKHRNVLLSIKKEKVAQFLYKAQQYAALKLHFYDGDMDQYATCVTDPKNFDNPFDKQSKNPCNALFSVMAEYASRHKLFSTVNVADLKSRAVVNRMGTLLIANAVSNGNAQAAKAFEQAVH